ncbi:tetratricopeptide repeat protein [Gellertiella hungarica]|uniref:Tetratricopeptide (TPR) repeat protein n=1 Tax=Gellertiella hungarica TaxID=1572859 RepID=A0A7W6J398_9HYPH|nr:FecR domain-containing protein [Gellertiella hungarica]MBB4063949.1 tetratricopeptide (TPR) repeat protein [Gellertiella hungarica]
MRDNFNFLPSCGTALAIGLGTLASAAVAEPVKRAAPAAGAVIDRKSGEEVRFVDLTDWRNVELKQDLLGGDVLRTNALGQLAILFADHTQVRLGRNSALQVKQMGTTEDTVLNLQSGTMWARAQRGGQGLTVETPAAAAAIRGTDWTLTVKGDQTSLIVLEGKIEFKNAYGSVEVREGEAAVASIGQAPRKLVIVTPKDRQQMLFYLTLRSGFTFMPATPLPARRMREEFRRIEAMAPEARSTEDWLTLAETRMALDGQKRAAEALEAIRNRPLSAAQKARVSLIDALIAGSNRRYDESAALFRKAERGLDPQRRAIAAYGGYFARSLADPDRIEQPPRTASGPYADIMQALTQGFLKDIPAAIAVIERSEARHPDDPTLPAVRALLHGLNGEKEKMQEAADRALSIDPEDPTALQARGTLRGDYLGDTRGAISDFKAAIASAPGDSSSWNSLGLAYEDLGASREAEEALLKAIALDPEDPVGYANLAILYLDQSRVKEAKALIDRALSVDPAFDIALVARGRYYLQTGETDKALEDLLAGATANPSYAQAQILLGMGHYIKGDRDPSNQAIDNADRLDRNDPVAPSLRTTLAIDDYDAEGAIRNAQDFMRRSRAQGGDFARLGANQDAGSTLNNAFRLQGLDAWGRYYGDVTFDPFAGAGYIDQAVRGQVNPYVNSYLYGQSSVTNTDSAEGFSSQLQGLLLDPHMLAGRSRTATLLRSPFLDISLGGGIAHSGGESKRIGEVEVQGYSNTPLPTSFLGNFTFTDLPISGSYRDFGGFDADTKLLDASGYLTMSPTGNDRIVIYGTHSRAGLDADALGIGTDLGIPLPQTRQRNDDNTMTNAGVGWSHTFSYHNVMNAALLYSGIEANVDRRYIYDLPFPFGSDDLYEETGNQKTYIAAVNHAVGVEDFTFRYGLEAGWADSTASFTANGVPLLSSSERSRLGRAYVDVLQDVAPDLKLEYALFGSVIDNDRETTRRFEPRFGVAWSPVENHWLRAAYMRNGFDLSTPTLSPIGVLGLLPNRFDLNGGYVDTAALQWDAEWTDRFFTSLEYQHQDLNQVTIGYPLTALPSVDGMELERGTIDRAAFTTNTVLGGGFGLSTTLALARSDNRDPRSASFGGDLSYVPDTAGQVALTWVNEAHVKATLAANYIGERSGNDSGDRLDDYWTLDASLTWEPLDKQIALEASAYNLLDQDFELAPGVPGWGPSFKCMLKVRF